MLGLPAQLIGFAGTALVVASLTPDPAAQSWSDYLFAAPSSKGDKLQVVVSKTDRVNVHTIEQGPSPNALVLRDKQGDVIFKSDPLTNTTSISKNVEFPVFTFREERRPAVQPSPPRPAEGIEPQKAGKRRPKVPGCEGVVSPLIKEETSLPGLCLVMREGRLHS